MLPADVPPNRPPDAKGALVWPNAGAGVVEGALLAAAPPPKLRLGAEDAVGAAAGAPNAEAPDAVGCPNAPLAVAPKPPPPNTELAGWVAAGVLVDPKAGVDAAAPPPKPPNAGAELLAGAVPEPRSKPNAGAELAAWPNEPPPKADAGAAGRLWPKPAQCQQHYDCGYSFHASKMLTGRRCGTESHAKRRTKCWG